MWHLEKSQPQAVDTFLTFSYHTWLPQTPTFGSGDPRGFTNFAYTNFAYTASRGAKVSWGKARIS